MCRILHHCRKSSHGLFSSDFYCVYKTYLAKDHRQLPTEEQSGRTETAASTKKKKKKRHKALLQPCFSIEQNLEATGVRAATLATLRHVGKCTVPEGRVRKCSGLRLRSPLTGERQETLFCTRSDAEQRRVWLQWRKGARSQRKLHLQDSWIQSVLRQGL